MLFDTGLFYECKLMESSSEDSFAWTDTSSDSIDSQSMPVGENTSEKNLKADKPTRRKGDCKESKLSHDTEELIHKELDCGTHNSAQSNMVKVEPESDCDIPRKKKKNKHVEVNSNENGLARRESTCYDESYLDLKVKQEEMAAPLTANKIKKKRNLSESADESQTKVKKTRVKEASPDSYNESQSSQLDTDIKTKKKKKKSKRRRESESQEETQSSRYKDCEDTISKEEVGSQSNSHTSRMEDTLVTDNTFENESCDDISAIQSDDHNIHTLSFNSGENVESKNKGDSLYKTAIKNQFKMDNHDEATPNRRPRLSDRIRFEDDSETEVSHTCHNASDMTSTKLKKFIKTIDNMKLISQELGHSSTLACDDEVWIVHCPKGIDVEGFRDADLNINEKSKMKVGGQTYDGVLDNEGCYTTAVLTTVDGKYQINNLPLSGIIKFRKRTAKPHFHDDNIMVNNQTDFRPPLETKCRHPLFGSNYKKALKIPSAIAQQLNSQNGPEENHTTEKRRKKKHRKDTNNLKHEETNSKCEVITFLEPEVMLKESEKKRKKRKHLDDEGPSPKKIKKIKHDPESAEAWESEKAIEQNLFSF